MRPLLCLCLTLAAIARANYAEEAYAATFKLHNIALNGTCSLYRRPAPDEAIYLVTTQHQMEGAKGDTCMIVLREPQADGSYKRNDSPIVIRKDGKPTWVRHPKLDLAVLKLTTPPKGTHATLPTSEIADEARLAAAKPAIGSPFLLLSFPHGIESVRAGFPVARQAIFAAPPLLSATAYPTFYADVHASPGDSGGPGFVEGANGRPLIVGMCFERENHDEKITTELTSGIVKHPLYLANFIHGKYLLETIEAAARP